ncbi:MAG: F0F1 ATP synthase subunit B [Bacteroidetes bacterium]|nr:F0F1 ATP synthase subunit B [Bacteroidota bacterium]
MFEINPGLMIWTSITFVALVIVLTKFAWKPMLTMIAKREEQIREALTQAEKARAEAAEMMRQNEQNLARAEDEYRRILREGKEMAEKLKDEIVSKARVQAEQELLKAQEEIQRSLEAARQELKSEVAELAIRAAEKILNESLDAQKHKNIIDSVLRQLPKN